MMNNKTVVVAILVGGKGTRLQSVISDVPKPLAPIRGEPFLFLILKELEKLKISQILLLTGYMHEKIKAACGDGSKFNLKIDYSQELCPLGTAGAIANARDYLEQYDEFILLNGDTFLTAAEISLITLSPLEKSAIGILGISEVHETKRYGSIQLDSLLRIQSFLEKNESFGPGLVNAGVYKFSKKILDLIPQSTFVSLEQNILPSIIKNGFQLYARMLGTKFHDIGLPESYFEFIERK